MSQANLGSTLMCNYRTSSLGTSFFPRNLFSYLLAKDLIDSTMMDKFSITKYLVAKEEVTREIPRQALAQALYYIQELN